MERDDVRCRIDIVERGRLDTELSEALGGDERVVGDDAHAQRERTARDLPSDPSETENAERLPRKLRSRVNGSRSHVPP